MDLSAENRAAMWERSRQVESFDMFPGRRLGCFFLFVSPFLVESFDMSPGRPFGILFLYFPLLVGCHKRILTLSPKP